MARPVAGKKSSKVIKKKREVEEEKPKKKMVGRKKKEEKKRGRPVGVKYVVPEEISDNISDLHSELESEMKDLRLSITKFVDFANKSAVKIARQHLMNITKVCKEFRVVLQDAKGNLEKE